MDSFVQSLGARLLRQSVRFGYEDVLDSSVYVLALTVSFVCKHDDGDPVREPPFNKRSEPRLTALVPKVLIAVLFHYVPSKTVDRRAFLHFAGRERFG